MPRALVTGGTRGIGKAIVARFASEGYEVVRPPRSELDLAQLEAVEAFAHRPEVLACDVLVNDAGINRPVLFWETSIAELQDHLTINVAAAFMLTKVVGDAMVKRGGGRIINIGSVYGSVGRPGRAMYSTTKAALDGLTRAAAVEFGPGNVLVNSVCPGFVDSELTRQNNTAEQIAKLCGNVPLGRLAMVDEVAELVYYLGSAKNTYITGQSIAIDGGFLCQ